MKIIVLLLLYLASMPAFADQDSDLAFCLQVAKFYQAAANDRDNGWSMTREIEQMGEFFHAPGYLNSGEEKKRETSLIYHAAIRDVYNYPTVQAQVFFGYELARCEATPPASPWVIYSAPVEGKS